MKTKYIAGTLMYMFTVPESLLLYDSILQCMSTGKVAEYYTSYRKMALEDGQRIVNVCRINLGNMDILTKVCPSM